MDFFEKKLIQTDHEANLIVLYRVVFFNNIETLVARKRYCYKKHDMIRDSASGNRQLMYEI